MLETTHITAVTLTDTGMHVIKDEVCMLSGSHEQYILTAVKNDLTAVQVKF